MPAVLWAAPSLNEAAINRKSILAAAGRYWPELKNPLTVTATSSPRSAGGKHDFFNEGDYWWPDEKDQKAPYIQRDGMTNPANIVDHRRAMILLSQHCSGVRLGSLPNKRNTRSTPALFFVGFGGTNLRDHSVTACSISCNLWRRPYAKQMWELPTRLPHSPFVPFALPALRTFQTF